MNKKKIKNHSNYICMYNLISGIIKLHRDHYVFPLCKRYLNKLLLHIMASYYYYL